MSIFFHFYAGFFEGVLHEMINQIVISRIRGAFRTVLVPRGLSKPEWLKS